MSVSLTLHSHKHLQVMHWSILDPAGAGHTLHSVNPDSTGKTKIVSRDLAVADVKASVHCVSATVDPTTGLKNSRFKRQVTSRPKP